MPWRGTPDKGRVVFTGATFGGAMVGRGPMLTKEAGVVQDPEGRVHGAGRMLVTKLERPAGTAMGRPVGRPVGRMVGRSVGRPGRAVGRPMGNPDKAVGKAVGKPVGRIVGMPMGRERPKARESDGSAMGNPVGSPVGSSRDRGNGGTAMVGNAVGRTKPPGRLIPGIVRGS
jgi:hypothetical protein